MAFSEKMGAKTGQNWEGQVNFFDSSSSALNIIRDDSLRKVMSKLVDTSEEIMRIWVYKCPLSSWQVTQLLFNHQFVVFQTPDWWWSIEKDDRRILIQKSKSFSCVRDRVNNEPRKKNVTQMGCDEGHKTIKDLIRFLYETNELYIKYDLLNNNCQDFAARIFDEFAKTKHHDKVFGSG